MKGKKNGGFSLLEIIIVIAILTVMGGILLVTMGNIGRYKVQEYTEILDSFMKKTRTDALAKNNICGFCIYQKNECYYIESYGEKPVENGKIEYQTVNVRELGSKAGIEIGISKVDGLDNEILENNVGNNMSSYIRIKYEGGTGAIADIMVNGVSKMDCQRITISKGEKQRWIEINPITGKHSKN